MNIRNLLLLLRHVSINSIEKGEILIREGATNKDIYFIRRGLIRSYYINEKTDEITFQLYPEYHIVTNINTILFNEPSKFSYQALEPTKFYKIGYSSFLDVTSKNPQLLELNRLYLGRRMMKLAYLRVESLVLLSPEERYQKYVEDYPNIINRAPDKYIANVLGITPVSLSRIRKRIASRKN